MNLHFEIRVKFGRFIVWKLIAINTEKLMYANRFYISTRQSEEETDNFCLTNRT